MYHLASFFFSNYSKVKFISIRIFVLYLCKFCSKSMMKYDKKILIFAQKHQIFFGWSMNNVYNAIVLYTFAFNKCVFVCIHWVRYVFRVRLCLFHSGYLENLKPNDLCFFFSANIVVLFHLRMIKKKKSYGFRKKKKQLLFFFHL